MKVTWLYSYPLQRYSQQKSKILNVQVHAPTYITCEAIWVQTKAHQRKGHRLFPNSAAILSILCWCNEWSSACSRLCALCHGFLPYSDLANYTKPGCNVRLGNFGRTSFIAAILQRQTSNSDQTWLTDSTYCLSTICKPKTNEIKLVFWRYRLRIIGVRKIVGGATSGIDSYKHVYGDLRQVEKSFSCKIGRIQLLGAVLIILPESKNVFRD